MHLNSSPAWRGRDERAGSAQAVATHARSIPSSCVGTHASLLRARATPAPNRQECAEERWRPILGVEQIIISVMSLLSCPNADSPANIDAGVRARLRVRIAESCCGLCPSCCLLGVLRAPALGSRLTAVSPRLWLSVPGHVPRGYEELQEEGAPNRPEVAGGHVIFVHRNPPRHLLHHYTSGSRRLAVRLAVRLARCDSLGAAGQPQPRWATRTGSGVAGREL